MGVDKRVIKKVKKITRYLWSSDADFELIDDSLFMALLSPDFINNNFQPENDALEIATELKNIYEAYRGILTSKEIKEIKRDGEHPDKISSRVKEIRRRESDIYNIPDIVKIPGGIACPRCGSLNTTMRLDQFRANDEAATQIFECGNCEYKQRTG